MSAHPVPIVPGLSAVDTRYTTLFCDVWGVVHNGVACFPAAVEALKRYRAERGATVVLVTNSPRRHRQVTEQLRDLGVEDAAYDAVVTSGDVTREHLLSVGLERVFHIGLARDEALYEGTGMRLVPAEEAEIVVATGLFDDETETPDDYHDLLAGFAARRLPFVSANPDIVVERGTRMVWCAGALAKLYESFGGEVVQAGKPYPPIYAAARARAATLTGTRPDDGSILAVGDGLPTDVRGGCNEGLDVLFVTGGIHAADFGPHDAPDPKAVATRLERDSLKAVAAVTALRW